MSLSDADAYDRFMGRYSRPLAVPFADFAGLPLDGRVLDVGCGPGALTAELARRARPGRVTAVDPSEEFVAAYAAAIAESRSSARRLRICRSQEAASMRRSPSSWSTSWTIRSQASRDGEGDADGGVVAACVWDFTDGGPIGPFWDAAQALDPEVETGLSAAAAGPATWPTSFARQESATSSTAPSRWTSSTPRSRTRGSRSRSASPRRVRTSPASSTIGARHCASAAGRGCRSHRS